VTLTRRLKRTFIGDRTFYRQVVAVLIPIIIQNTVTNVVSLVDNVMVGAVGTLQMSAVAIVNQLLFVFYLCIFGGLSGAGIFTAQYAGADDKDGIRHTFRFKWYLAIFLLAAAMAVLLLMPDTLINMYLSESTSKADAAATLGYGKDYLKIMLIGLVPFAISQVYGSTLRELGETRLPMIASVAAIFVNIIFNYIFIFGNEGLSFLPFAPMGVAGAAIATVMSRYVEFLIIIATVHKNKFSFDFIVGVYKSFKIPLPLCKEICVKGLPLLLNEFLWSFGMAGLMQCYSLRGIDVVAATNISSTVSNLFNVIYISMGTAIAIMVGQALGANKIEEAKSTVWRLLALSIATCFVTGTALFALSGVIPNIYNTSAHVRSLATELIRIFCIFMPVCAFTHGCYFAIRSGGKTIVTMIFDSGFIWIVSYPLAFIIGRFTSLPILPFYFIVQGVEAIKAVIAFVLVKKGVWINNIIKE
jgi:putative MATE family efflux protein